MSKRHETKAAVILYSGGQTAQNHRLHERLVQIAQQRSRRKSSLRMTYIPFCKEGSVEFFMRSVRRYEKFGVSEFCCLIPESLPSSRQVAHALDAEIIYLAGGNTFYFLSALRKSRLLPELQERLTHPQQVFAGLSAGAHLLTPSIRLAGYPGLDPDRNEVGIKKLNAISAVDFEVLPHFGKSPREVAALQRYVAESKVAVAALPDGSGVIVEGSAIYTLGRGIQWFHPRTAKNPERKSSRASKELRK